MLNVEEEKREEMLKVAMQIIMNAGDARIDSLSALKSLRTFDFEAAKKLLESAQSKILLAHEAQTELIQKEAGGENYENSLLFTHAQDTLMTAKSQVEMSAEVSALVEALFQKIEGRNLI